MYLALVHPAHVCYVTLYCFTLVPKLLTEARMAKPVLFAPLTLAVSECILANRSNHGHFASCVFVSTHSFVSPNFSRKVAAAFYFPGPNTFHC